MQRFTASRQPGTPDEIWNLEHEPVFTLGRAGREIHLRNPGDIPVQRVDRGGQITYHGPGQLTQYLLLDLNALGLGVRQLVTLMEHAIVTVLYEWKVVAKSRPDAPGVYVDGAKIAALGLRISRGYSYHGLSFNIQMDMSPWDRINPCGLGVPVTQLSDWLNPCPDLSVVGQRLTAEFTERLGYNVGAMQFIPTPTSQLDV